MLSFFEYSLLCKTWIKDSIRVHPQSRYSRARLKVGHHFVVDLDSFKKMVFRFFFNKLEASIERVSIVGEGRIKVPLQKSLELFICLFPLLSCEEGAKEVLCEVKLRNKSWIGAIN